MGTAGVVPPVVYTDGCPSQGTQTGRSEAAGTGRTTCATATHLVTNCRP